MRKRFLKNASLVALLLSSPAMAKAATGDKESEMNLVLITLVGLIVIFMLAIGLLAVVLRQLAEAYGEKSRKEKANNALPSVLATALLSFGVLSAKAQGAMATSEPAAAVSNGFISGIAENDFYFLIGLLCFELLIMLVLLYQIMDLVRALRGIPKKELLPNWSYKGNLLDLFNKSVAVEKEQDILLDHDYDGIRELDNALPPWWKYGFLLTIVFAFVYFGYYQVAGGPTQADEYLAAVAVGEAEKAAYLAKSANNVDENTVTMVLDANELASAATLFENTCAACHLKDGGGSVGPNLTDDYWLHGGSISDVFKTIKYGWPEKGMKSWKEDFSPKQIAALSSYVKSLKGTKPAVGKAPQGDLFVEGRDKAIDSIGANMNPGLQPTGGDDKKDKPAGAKASKL
jgi:cytochrome c oxidase cbb3-type subunit 3